ncbi:hypothetical protein J4E86_007496 [Alternaria arbusti]|uniref:uncharacterized protein n=1 Tax=Alternaria arbusti TaxID=232088 RepID=UPI00221E6764|nr:uncharacterized protein J4E86_007496 [Alternaria arbusti]KAI4950987.1 hypothetical protein J4E86_007496 [Alternaria arbusti]
MAERDPIDADRDESDDGSAMHTTSPVKPMEEAGKDDTRIADYQPETPSNYVTLDTFAELTNHLRTRRCRVCDELFFSSELDIRNLFQDWADGTVDELSCNLRCSNCNTRSCIACEPVAFKKSSKVGFASQNVSWCCVGGRLFLIWALLCGFDRRIWESRNLGNMSKQVKPELKSKAMKIQKSTRGGGLNTGPLGGHRFSRESMPSGKGYGGHTSGSSGHDHDMYDDDTSEDDGKAGYDINGLPFNVEALEDMYGKAPTPNGFEHIMNSMKPNPTKPKPKPKPKHVVDRKDDFMSKARIAQKKEDYFSITVLDFLTDLLPSLERETCFDLDPPGAILEMLNNSKILPYCAELLRNDSLADVTNRKFLYQALFSFLTRVGSHSSTNAAVFGPRYARPETIDLLTLSFNDGVPDAKERVTTLAECLRNLTTQSSMMLRSANTNFKDFDGDEDLTMLQVCDRISIFTDFIQTHMITATDSVGGKATVVVPDGLGLRDVDSTLMSETHYYWNTAKGFMDSQPGRFKRLITEITTLQTGLPPGIFVRYCEDRPDILKCVIVGPADTPYENGLFEFDIFCGQMFPNLPPQVNFKGTAGGRLNINPNLYADGKVCLSLLGTWSGEPWNPGESTLLQVLISIQAMILCEEPWYNEPGREAGYTRSPNGPSSMYNRKIRDHTVRTAILAWLDEPPPLWKDVVDFHFKQQGNTILRTVEEWVKERVPETNKSAFERTIEEEMYAYDEAFAETMAARYRVPEASDLGAMLPHLQTALRKYGATFIVEYVAPPTPKAPKRRMVPASHFGPGLSPYPPGPGGPTTSSSEAPTGSSMASSSEAPTWASVAKSSPAQTDTQSMFKHLDDFSKFMDNASPEVAASFFRGRGQHRGGFGRGHTAADTNGPAVEDSAEAPRYELRSSTRGRGSSDEPSTRGGQSSSSTSHPPYNSNTMNFIRGRGGASHSAHGFGRGGFGRGGRGSGLDGSAPVFPPPPPAGPLPPVGFYNVGRGRGGPPPSDNFTMGDAPTWVRGGGRGRGRGNGRGDRGGRGRGRG